jgi:hypothetical protein
VATHIDDELWVRIQESVPIVSVDLLPVREPADRERAVGLIQRSYPDGSGRLVWSPIGGRLRRDESLRSALLRHVSATLVGVTPDLPPDPQPGYVMQWLSQPPDRERFGVDPRKHSVGLTFVCPLVGEPAVDPAGEAVAFGWFSEAEVRGLDLWPGTEIALRALVFPDR